MGGNTLAEGDGSGNLTAEYIYFGGKRVARIDLPANTVHYYLSDHLGSTSIVASAAGAIEEVKKSQIITRLELRFWLQVVQTITNSPAKNGMQGRP
jgi:hypothetical protein